MSPAAGDGRLEPLPAPVPGVRLWVARLRPCAGDAEGARLDAAELARVAGMRPVEAGRLLARRVLLRAAVASVADCAPAGVELPAGAGPRRARGPAGGTWWVSSSSSGDVGLLAVAAGPVGVDVERRPGPPDALVVSAELLAPAEHAWIAAGGARAPERFLDTWVRKEAVLKCTGEGLQRDLRSFVVDAAVPSAPVGGAGLAALGLRTDAVAVEGHAAALAVAGAPPPRGPDGTRP
ncbi:4'-phosphopantetheinyl transferase [Kineococcus xinjiangensis]|uniref:4'-phosphopantetheinyl transferase n=1 Tax=Kineococcus xinjiangensis TaxID=512762 RepID=A0A2S6ISN1_9ACTN|nr:4'-phosphopantetheinyl transferase superfamily protein [Kineococcus xinjiangensis]PPK97263.1 4'-phosphopantetheinyl transferase [Kineococcus xinjiangensis]